MAVVRGLPMLHLPLFESKEKKLQYYFKQYTYYMTNTNVYRVSFTNGVTGLPDLVL